MFLESCAIHTFRCAFKWAYFLGSSWTWCIGMFLPVLLIRDYGIGSFFVFAIPNILGAAAMGFVFRDRVQAWRFAEAHLPAALWFSAATIGFHLFFAEWFIVKLLPIGGAGAVIVIAIFFFLVGSIRDQFDIIPALIVWCVSIALMLIALFNGQIPDVAQPLASAHASAWWLLPVCALGFSLCPYLDLTFHRAYQESANPRVSFAFGFGFVFATMIVATLLYSGAAARELFPINQRIASRVLLLSLSLHMILQSGFTVAIHARSMLRQAERVGMTGLATGFIVLGAAILVMNRLNTQRIAPGMESGEMIYRLFMALYGLVFPAYVWICTASVQNHIQRVRGLWVFVVVVSLAAPFYWLGFVMKQPWGLIAGVAVVALGRPIAAMMKPSTASPETTSVSS